MTQIVKVFDDEGEGTVRLGFALQQPGGLGGSDVLGFDGTPRWDTTYKNYE